ncbi:ABC transporter substrate-binding protein [Streptococcus sp. DD13]|uniref:ABC transporter substrate-binding protein n=1 Tax=Streptococcus sp. DD13 TaxID=1777881 RepID=UPI00079696A2|nr:ABC transporter substrate-binding protein [Streptococcus sp. DD13]KXT78801.1 ABC transporter, periplasmic spermidine putrescine-binding protein PotD [Streptococcus sp. DD13]
MKRLYSFFLGIIAIILLLWGISFNIESSTQSSDGNKLVIYNWGDYIDPELLKEFTKETGIQVQYETFDSNEAMYTKIKQGGTTYDIAIPSEYMIAKMMEEGLLEKLDHTKIQGLEHIDSQFLNQSFDPGNHYSVPYFWGTLGIIYNTKMVDKAPEHWTDLWRPEYKNQIMMIDGAREVMGIGLNSLGYSLNSKNAQELQEAVDKLYTLTPNIKAIVADEMKGYMIQNNAAIGVSFSGEARQMLEGNEDLRYVVPSEASNLWFDNIVIPKTVKNQDAAYAFINFMLRPENAYKNALYVGYATPNKEAKAMLPEEVRNDPSFYPSGDTMKHLEVYEQLGKKWLGIYNDLYLQVKMYRK